MANPRASGFSLVEALVALALVAGVSAMLPPALAVAARLQRDSAIETEAALIAASRLESLKADVAAGRAGAGGSLDAAHDGWHARIDRDGTIVPAGRAAYECRWRVTPAPAAAGAWMVSVRVVPAVGARLAVTISTAVQGG
jgi:type II secretory pathway pseudopilin PulG